MLVAGVFPLHSDDNPCGTEVACRLLTTPHMVAFPPNCDDGSRG